MGFLDRLFGKKRGQTVGAAPPLPAMHGRETLQTADEQAATRRRMEEELDAQRARRAQAGPPDA